MIFRIGRKWYEEHICRTRGPSSRYRHFCLIYEIFVDCSWWRHQMEAFSAILALCAGNSPVNGEFPAQRPVTRSFDFFFDLRWINGWVNNHEAGDVRRHRAHYDVNVMRSIVLLQGYWEHMVLIRIHDLFYVVLLTALALGGFEWHFRCVILTVIVDGWDKNNWD